MISFQSFLEMSFLCFFLVFRDTISKLWCILDFILRLFNWRIAFLCSSNYKIFREIVSEFISMHFEFFKNKTNISSNYFNEFCCFNLLVKFLKQLFYDFGFQHASALFLRELLEPGPPQFFPTLPIALKTTIRTLRRERSNIIASCQ